MTDKQVDPHRDEKTFQEVRSSIDDIIDFYKKDVDREMLRSNLNLSVEQRLNRHEQLAQWFFRLQGKQAMSARTVTIEEASQQLAELVERAEAGDEIVILNQDRPAARLIPINEPRKREFGQYRDLIKMSEDFDEPLPAEFWLGKDQ